MQFGQPFQIYWSKFFEVHQHIDAQSNEEIHGELRYVCMRQVNGTDDWRELVFRSTQ